MLSIDVKTRVINEIHLSGTMDEKTNLKARVGPLGGKVYVYTRGLSHSNSFGLKEWILFWDDCRKKGSQIEFMEVSPFLVSAINSVVGFIPIREIRSVCVPFYCKRCEKETIDVLTVEEILALKKSLPEGKCDSCQSKMEFNEHEDYFAFLHQ